MQIIDPYGFKFLSTTFSPNQHTDRVNSLKLLNDTILASGSYDSSIKLWEFSSGKYINTIPTSSPVKSLLLLPNNFLAVALDNSNNIDIYDWKTGNKQSTLNHGGQVNALELLSSKKIASGSNDHYIKIWICLPTGAVNFLYYLDCSADVLCLKYLPNDFLASGVSGNSIYLWDLATNKKVAQLKGHSSTILCLEVLPNSDLASGSEDFIIKVWDIFTYAHKYDLEGHSAAVTALKLLSNGFLASGSTDQKVKVWDPYNRTLVGEIDTNKAVYSLELLGK